MAALLAAALAGSAGDSFAAEPTADTSASSDEGLIVRAKQALTFGRSQSPTSNTLDRQNPSKTTFGAAPSNARWWKPWSNKPIRRTALDFWSEDSTTH